MAPTCMAGWHMRYSYLTESWDSGAYMYMENVEVCFVQT